MERHTRRMYERREETWRPLTPQRVAAFIRLFLLYMVEGENGVGRPHPETVRSLNKALVRRVIPWIYNRVVFTMDESMWPITLEQFRELDQYLADHLPRIQKDDPWGTVAYFFKEMLRERETWKRLEELEREAMEAVRRVLGS